MGEVIGFPPSDVRQDVLAQEVFEADKADLLECIHKVAAKVEEGVVEQIAISWTRQDGGAGFSYVTNENVTYLLEAMRAGWDILETGGGAGPDVS